MMTCSRFYDEVDLVGSVESFASNNAMHLSSSLNFFQKVEVKNVTFDPRGNPIEVADSDSPSIKWVIQPKWETPVLDFSNAPVTLPTQGTGSVPLGLWHQYGEVPSASPSSVTDEGGNTTVFAGSDKGLFISIQDLQDEEKNIPTLTGSLADLVGFSKSERKLGSISQASVIKEAIVAIPFTRKQDGSMRFYHIPRGQVDIALGKDSDFEINPGKSITQMVSAMKKYVIPPQLDFITNETVDPFAMYLFEFKHVLTQKDLSDIWQNLPPESLMKIKEPKESIATVEHELLINELFGLGPSGKTKNLRPETQWMIFKVKQKAEKNYYAMTANTADDTRFKFNFEIGDSGAEKESVPDYGYNWPYDFFSMVEMVQMDADIILEPGTNFEENTDALDAIKVNPALQVQPGKKLTSAKTVTPPKVPENITGLLNPNKNPGPGGNV